MPAEAADVADSDAEAPSERGLTVPLGELASHAGVFSVVEERCVTTLIVSWRSVA